MSFIYFIVGFLSAFGFLAALIVVGGKKGHEYIQKRLEELKTEQAKNPKKQEALKLEPVKQVGTVRMEIMAGGKSNHSIKAKLSLTGTKLKIHVIEEKSKENPEGGVADKPVAILTTTGIACRMEDRVDPPPRTLHLTSNDPSVSPLFKDERDGQADWLRADIKFDTVRECERWYNVFHANNRTLEWKSHVKALPSVDVFNVFLSRVLFNLNNDPEFEEKIAKKITKKLEAVKLPLQGTLKLNTLTVGKQIPFIEGVSFISYNSTSGEFAFDFNLTYGGGFNLQLCAQLHLRNIALPPVIITVEIEKLEGNVHLSVGAPPSNKAWIGFHEAPKIQLNIKQEVHTGKQGGLLSHFVKAIPDLSDVITDIVKVKLFEDMILPNMDDIPLPDVKDTPPSTPTKAALIANAKHATTFGPGGTVPVPPDHPKPAGYPGTTATSTPAMAAVVTAATAGGQSPAAAPTPVQTKRETKTPSPAAQPTATATPPAAPADSPKKRAVDDSEGSRGTFSRGNTGEEGEEMKELPTANAVNSFSADKTEDSAAAVEENKQLDEMEQRSQQRSEAMKEAVTSSTTSRTNSTENANPVPSTTSRSANTAAPVSNTSLPAGYPGTGTSAPGTSPYGANPYGASPYASTNSRAPEKKEEKAPEKEETVPEKKEEAKPTAVPEKKEEAKPTGYPSAQPQYTYSTQQPQWSSASQPQWGK